GGSRLPPPPPEEQTDGESEGLCSPPTSPSGSYMTAEGGSWGSSGTASTSPSCSPNLVAEAEAMAVAEAEGEEEEDDDDEDEDEDGALVEGEAVGALPMDSPAFAPPAPQEEEDDGPFAPPGEDEEDEDGQTPEEEEEEDEEEEEEWGVSEDAGLIPAALLPFRGSLLFQAEAVEIAPLPPGTAPLPLSLQEDEEEDEEEEEEEEEGGSTSASFLRSLSETSITEGVDESFAFRDDTSASSDSAAYDGEEDERLYGTERHALGTEGAPAATAAATHTSRHGGIELHLHAGTAPAGCASPEGSPRHRHGQEPLPEEAMVMPGSEEEPAEKDDSGTAEPGEEPGTEPVTSGNVLQPPGLCSREPRDPQTDGPWGDDVTTANGEPQGGHGSDGDGDGDPELGTVRAGSTEPPATDGHEELDAVATSMMPLVMPSPMATDLMPSVTPSPVA
ncbi:NACAD protein, partial [Pluvianellus socialis]|nr:NACAD protein [Pluvianellus socialis]